MAKVKNTGGQPRGFVAEDGSHVVVPPGGEKEFNMTEADFNHLKKVIEDLDPKPFELSGSHGGAKKEKKEKEEDEMPAQSTEPPASEVHQAEAAVVANPAERPIGPKPPKDEPPHRK